MLNDAAKPKKSNIPVLEQKSSKLYFIHLN